MANRSILRRLTECSPSQQEAVARSVGLHPSALPPAGERDARAQEIVLWATGPDGPGLLALEAALPWTDDSDMARQFGVSSGRPTLLPASADQHDLEELAAEPAAGMSNGAKEVVEQAGPRLSPSGPAAVSRAEETVHVGSVGERVTAAPTEPPEPLEPAEHSVAAVPPEGVSVAESVTPPSASPEKALSTMESVPEPDPAAAPSGEGSRRPSVFGGGRAISVTDRPTVRDRPERPAAPAAGTTDAPRRVERPATPALGGTESPEPVESPRPGEQTAANSFDESPTGDTSSDAANGPRRWWRRLLRGRHAH